MTAFGPSIGGLFEGYGGLTMGVQAVLGGTISWHSEIDPDASRILTHHWPDVPNLGDITKVDWSQVPRVDVLTLGFPCQDLSTAGSRHGMTPTNRSGLWSHAAYAISQLRPALAVVENVRGLLTSRGAEPTDELMAAWAERDRLNRIIALIQRKRAKAIREGKEFYVRQHTTDRLRFMGRYRRAVAAVRRADARIVRAIGTVLGDLARLGFDAQWCGLRAADIGAPHGRYRIFIVAWDATGFSSDVSLNDGSGAADGTVGQGRSIGRAGICAATDAERGRRDGRASVARRCALNGTPTPRCGPATRADVFAGRWCACESATADTASDPRRLSVRDRDTATDTARLGRGSARGDDGLRAEGLVQVDWGQYAPAIDRWERALGRVAPAPTELGAKGGQRLSPRFVEWMQGLPEGHVTDPAIGISRNAQLKALGNGVVPQQAAAAVEFLLSVAERAA